MDECAESVEFSAGDPFTVLREAVVAAAFVARAVEIIRYIDAAGFGLSLERRGILEI